MPTLMIGSLHSMFPFYLRKVAVWLVGFSLLILGRGSIEAADPVNGGPFGVRVVINTTGYRFQQPLVQDADARGGSFGASASITNGSRTAVPFSFPQGLAEGERIVFKVFNSDGVEMWRSEAAPAGAPVDETLRPGRTWKRTARIPLVPNGVALPVGTYSVEAGLANGDPVLASTIFEVMARPVGPAVPVNGFVLKSYFDGKSTQFHSFAAGAWVTASRVSEGFRYIWFSGQDTVVTGSDGRFSAAVEPGRYEISAILQASTPIQRGTSDDGLPLFIGLPAFSHGSVKVTASEGKVCQPVIMLGGSELQRIHGTGEVTIARDAAEPGTVIVKAQGVVNTGGWSSQMLVSQELTTEGILLLDFMARPPAGGATQAFATVDVTMKMPLLPGMKGVRVRSLTNAVTAVLAQ